MSDSSDEKLRSVLAYDRIAVVGCSTTPGKAAHDVPAYLMEQGYTVIPVNPFADQVLGETAYDSVGDIPTGLIDVVEIFRPSDEVREIVDAAITREDVAAIWTQLDIRDDAAAADARAAGITVVQDHCMKIEHERLGDTLDNH